MGRAFDSIRKVIFTCARCAREIPVHARYVSAVRPASGAEDVGFERFDYCAECWTAQDVAAFFSRWDGRRPAPEPKRRRGPDPDRMAALLRALLARGSDDPGLPFVLALGLFRTRRLELAGTRWEERREFLAFRWRGTEERFELKNPDLTDTRIAALNAQLLALLDDPPAAGPAAAGAPARVADEAPEDAARARAEDGAPCPAPA